MNLPIRACPKRVIEVPDFAEIARIVAEEGFMVVSADDIDYSAHATLHRRFLLGMTRIKVGKKTVAWSIQPARKTSRRKAPDETDT